MPFAQEDFATDPSLEFPAIGERISPGGARIRWARINPRRMNISFRDKQRLSICAKKSHAEPVIW